MVPEEVPEVVECETHKAPELYTAATWLAQRLSVCSDRESGTAKKKGIVKGEGLTDVQQQKLAELMIRSCPAVSISAEPVGPLVAPIPLGVTGLVVPGDRELERERGASASGSTEQSFNSYIQQLAKESGWPADYQSLFTLLDKMIQDNQRLLFENQRIRLEMQQKIDALMQLEKDISNRGVR